MDSAKAITSTAQREQRDLSAAEERELSGILDGLDLAHEQLAAERRNAGDHEGAERSAREYAEARRGGLDAVAKWAAQPAAQVPFPDATTRDMARDDGATSGTVLRPEQRMTDWLKTTSTRSQAEGLSFGAFARAIVQGSRSPLERRALQESTGADGGYTVPEYVAANVIDVMRAKAQVIQAGASTVPMRSMTERIARLTSDPAATWKVELAPQTPSSPTFDAVILTARTLVSLVKISRELLQDSVNVEAALTNAFAKSLALEVDRVALRGSGTAPEPRGIRTTTGVAQISMGTNGAPPTYDALIDAREAIVAANGNAPTAAIMATRTQSSLGKLKDSTLQPLRVPAILADVQLLGTTQVLTNETQGTATNASTVYVGDFSQLLIGVRSELSLEVVRDLYADQLAWAFLAWLRCDIALAHPQSFARIIGVTP